MCVYVCACVRVFRSMGGWKCPSKHLRAYPSTPQAQAYPADSQVMFVSSGCHISSINFSIGEDSEAGTVIGQVIANQRGGALDHLIAIVVTMLTVTLSGSPYY